MADVDQDQKTEAPTGKRLGEARDKGQLPTSRELNTWISFLGILLVTKWLIVPMAAQIIAALRVFVEMPHALSIEGLGLQTVIFEVLQKVAMATAYIFIVMVTAAIVGPMVQHGFFASTTLITPDIMRLSPMNGIKRLFSTQSIVELLKSFLKMVVLGIAVFFVLMPIVWDSPGFSALPLMAVLAYMQDKAIHLMIIMLLIFAFIALGDLMYQRFTYFKSLRMTKAEVKDEYKQQEGDPQIKSRLRAIRMDKARKRMMANVPKADVIITNPTHYAIALQYDNKKMTAPLVLAMGINLIAERIRDLGEKNNIPLVSNPPLARALYDTVEVNHEIPTQHYRAVAEVISYVYKLRNRKF